MSGLVATLLELLPDGRILSTFFPSGVSEVGLISLVFLGAIGMPPNGCSRLRSNDDPPWPLESADSEDDPARFLPRAMISPGGGKAVYKKENVFL